MCEKCIICSELIPKDVENSKFCSSECQDKTAICRISRLFDGIIAGKDMAKIFKEGHVYEVTKIMDVIMIEDLGENALTKKHLGWQFQDIMMDGCHLITKKGCN